ncbi:MAG: ECF RNA polymerase sigma factor SigK [Microbacteriaceae bacterium]
MLEDVTGDIGEPAAEALLARVGRGDTAAFAQFYDRFAPKVLGLVRRLIRDHAQSEEVTQEVFLEIWQSASRFDPNKAGASTWTMTMAHRRAIDRIRSAQATRNRDIRVGIRDYGTEYDQVAEAAEVRIEHERVEAAMHSLSEAQRQAVSLAYYGGLTHTELAERLSIPVGTVKTRLRDGMSRLRNELGVTP